MVGGCVNEYWGKGTLLVHGVRERGIGEKVAEKQGGDIKGFKGDGSDERISQQIRIVTSLPGDKSASCIVTGTVSGSSN